MDLRSRNNGRLSRREVLRASAGATGAMALGLGAFAFPGAAHAQSGQIEVPGFDSEVEPQPVRLTLWTFVDTHARWFEAMGEAYRAQVNPDFELEVVQTAYPDHHSKLLVSMQAGGVGAPDLADIEQGQFGTFMRLPNAMEELTDRLQDGGYLEDLVAARQSLYTVDGRMYGIEHALTPVVLYYRSDLYTNVSPDEPLATWDDFIEATKDLVAADSNVRGIGLNWGLYDMVLRQRGYGLFDAEGNVTADSPEAIETLEWMLALRDEHGIAAEPPAGAQASGTAADQSWYAAIREGQFVAVPGADWYAGFLKDNVPELAGQWEAQYLPAFEPGGARTSVNGGTGLTILSSGENKDAAWDFARYSMLTTEGNVQRFLEIKLWPPLQSAWEDERLYSGDEYFGGQELGRLFAEVGTEVPEQYQSPFRADLLQLRQDNYTRPIFDGEVTPAEGLQQLAEEVRELM